MSHLQPNLRSFYDCRCYRLDTELLSRCLDVSHPTIAQDSKADLVPRQIHLCVELNRPLVRAFTRSRSCLGTKAMVVLSNA